jgi:adenylosuccinate synthase
MEKGQVKAVVGSQWGDEGKGRMIDYFAQKADMVVRFQGGNNAGHTVVNEFGTFKLHLIPSGIFNPKVVNILGPGMIIDLEALCSELDELKKQGIDVSNILISDRATICFPYYVLQDGLEEERLGKNAYGSTKRGISPAYGDRYLKKAIQVGELLYPEKLKEHLKNIIDWKNLEIENVYHHQAVDFNQMYEWAVKYGEKLKNYICDTAQVLSTGYAEGKKILFEAQLGALRDINFGIYPFTSSSPVLASYAPLGGSFFEKAEIEVVSVMKAFSTCVGAGPFVTEIFGEVADSLRETAMEYGAATGRPRRIGHFDAVAARYGAKIQNSDYIALTKLDCLSGQEELQICTHYEVNGKKTENFPINSLLDDAKPVYIKMTGWKADITAVRNFEDLSAEAKEYIEKIEELLAFPVKYISVGPERESLIVREAVLVG